VFGRQPCDSPAAPYCSLEPVPRARVFSLRRNGCCYKKKQIFGTIIFSLSFFLLVFFFPALLPPCAAELKKAAETNWVACDVLLSLSGGTQPWPDATVYRSIYPNSESPEKPISQQTKKDRGPPHGDPCEVLNLARSSVTRRQMLVVMRNIQAVARPKASPKQRPTSAALRGILPVISRIHAYTHSSHLYTRATHQHRAANSCRRLLA
jgi:hypothetical protein